MVKRLDSNIAPLHKDKYYVYALFKPNDVNPFYVGKGIRERINDHFKECNLKGNSPKKAVIKKYGNSIRREILCYFDSENSAYEFEEYLIELYGLISEGGCLTNYAKTRFQYSDKFRSEISSIGYLYRARKHNKQTVMVALSLFYKDNLPLDEISVKTGISRHYLLSVVKGLSYKLDFKEFANDNGFTDEYLLEIFSSNMAKQKSVAHSSISAEVIKVEFDLVCSCQKHIKDAAKSLNMSENHLRDIFLGKARLDIRLDVSKYKAIAVKGKLDGFENIRATISRLYENGLSGDQIAKESGYGRTTVFRHLKAIRSENAA